MKKKLFALLLAATMISSFGLAACDNSPKKGAYSDDAAGLINALADFEANNAHLTFTGTTKTDYTYSYSGNAGNTKSDSKIDGEATIAGTDFDLYEQSTEKSEQKAEGSSETFTSERLDAMLLFKRGDNIYMGDLGVQSDEEEKKEFPNYTFDTALAEFTKADSENYLESNSEANMTVGSIMPLALSGPAMKIIKNLAGLVNATYAKAGSGYTLSYNLKAVGEELLDKAIALVDALDENTATVKDAYNNTITQDLLGKLLKGVTAEEVKGLVTAALTMAGAPQEVLAAFPEATGSALDYVNTCLASTSFAKVANSEKALETYTVKELFGLMGTDKASVLELLRQVRQNVGRFIAIGVTGMSNLSEDSKFDANIVFNFTTEKALSSIALDFEGTLNHSYSYGETQTSTTKEEFGIHAELTFPGTVSLKSLKGAKVWEGYQYLTEPKVLTASKDIHLEPIGEGEEKTITRHFTFTFSFADKTLTVKGECQEEASLSFNQTISCSGSGFANVDVNWMQDEVVIIDGVQYYCDSQSFIQVNYRGTYGKSSANAEGFVWDNVGDSFDLSEPVYTTLEA